MLKDAANSKKTKVGIFALILSALLLGGNSPVHAADGTLFKATGTAARKMTTDQAGNLYVANYASNSVTKITPSGESTTFGPTGGGPRGLAVDALGNIYTANIESSTVSKITPEGVVTKEYANVGAGSRPYTLILDKAGNIFTINGFNRTISKITPVSSVLGTPSVFASFPQTDLPLSVAIDQADNLYVGVCGPRIDVGQGDTPENLHNDVRKITPAGVVTIVGTTGQCPSAVVLDSSGNIYTSNYGAEFGGNITKITPTGVSTIFATLATTDARPYELVVDPLGNFYTANYISGDVSKITPAGLVTRLGSTAAPSPFGMVYSSGNIYTSSLDGTISKFQLASVASGTAPNSKVITLSTGDSTATTPATAALPATTLSFGGTVPTAVTVVPVTTNPAPEASTPFTISGSTKIVDIQITGTFTGSATVCLDGAETDQLFHYVGGKWEELPSRTYVPGSPGQVCGVTTSFSPFAAASTAAKTAAAATAAATAAASAAAKAAAEAAAAKREAEKQAARADITSKLKSAKDLTVDAFAKAEIPGITAGNIAAVQAELLALPESSRTDINQVLKVAHKYEVVGNIGSDQVLNMQSNSFVEIGLIPATSKNKVALVAAVKKLPAASRDTYAEIKAAIDAATKEIQVRSDRLAAIISRNASRNSK